MNLELKDLKPEQIESLKKQITEFEKENEKPKDEIDYVNGYVITGCGFAKTIRVDNDEVKVLFILGLYRDTQEEAEKLLRKMQIEHRLRQWEKMCKEKVDWNNSGQNKYYCYTTRSDKKVGINVVSNLRENNIYFTNGDVLQRAIKDIGEQNLIDNYFVEV